MNVSPQLIPLHDEDSLSTLVENRSTYTLENCELNVFETHRRAEKVNLVFSDLVLTSMLRGKKIMHLPDKTAFEYLPGESVLVQPHERMTIDFPEARADNPTQCMALSISADQIRQTLDLLNERFPLVENHRPWHLSEQIFHLHNNEELMESIGHFIRICIQEKTREKDLLAGLALKELLIRLMQTQARSLFEANYQQMTTRHRFAHVIQYIKQHIREEFNMDQLSEQACMSRSSFFKSFKREFGYTPNTYILKERIRLAKEYLKNPLHSVTQACYMAGFNNLNYFIRAFKKEAGITPSAFKQQLSRSSVLLPAYAD